MNATATLPRRMRAARLIGHGGFECLQYASDIALPQVGAGEVLIRLQAAALNNTDINLRTGWYSKSAATADAGWTGAAVRLPLIQGADGCGVVVAASAADESLLGQRVIIDPIVRLRRDGVEIVEYLGTDRDGCFAEYVAVPAANALPVRCDWSAIELASVPCAHVAAEHMLLRAAVSAGDCVLVTGASGGVGSAAVQLARRRGAGVVAIAARGKTAALQSLGAERVVPRDADLSAAMAESSVDVVIDCVGGGQFADLLRVLRPGGRYAVAGAIGGALVELDLRTLYLKDLSLYGCTVAPARVMRDLVAYIERGELRPQVAQVFALSQLEAAQRAFLEKRHVGKIVVDIEGDARLVSRPAATTR